MSDEMLYYPRARIAAGNGDLMDIEDFSVEVKNNGKLKHTQRRSPSGVVKGNTEANVSFNAILSEKGWERDYVTAILNGTIKQIRVKVPGETIVISGIYTDRKVDAPLDDAIKYAVQFIGKPTVTPV